MSAELVAKVVRDLRLGRVHSVEPREELDQLNHDTTELAKWATVVDTTEVFNRWMAEPSGGRQVYEDHRICPPWDNALICFVNEYSNVCALSVRAIDITDASWGVLPNLVEQWESTADTHSIEWGRVRWIIHIAVYVGGMGGGKPAPTLGPTHAWRIAVYPDGEIADVNWIQLMEKPIQTWDTAVMVLLDTFNMLNCVNVEIAEPQRPRHERKRVSRMGVTVNEIHVKPTSRSYRGIGTPLSAIPSSPLSSVRGHYASYGPKYGRGLLFGKYEGRFWIPQHIRGSEILGVSEQEYLVEP